jgi:phosphate transport system substrate-binding protein
MQNTRKHYSSSRLILVGLILALGITRCSFFSPAPPPDLSGRILLGGSGAAYPALQVLTSKFVEQNPHVTVVYETTSQTAAAIKFVAEERIDIGLIARTLNENEKQFDLKEIPIARDAVIIATNPSVWITNLTTSQIRDIFNGTIHSWAQVGGAAREIVVLDRVEGETAKIALRRHVLGADLPVLADVIVLPTEKDMYRATAMVPDAIGYFSLTYAIQNPNKVNVLMLDGVAPALETIHSGAYRIIRPIGIVVNPKRMNTSPLREFLTFLNSDAARVALTQSGLVPEVTQ